MTVPRLRFAAVVCLLVFLSPILLAADVPWDGVPFSADPQKVRDAASGVPAKDDNGVVVLLEEARYVFDDSGHMQRTEYLVYRVADESAVEAWWTIEVPWSPWYSERPVVDARVITKDRLDAKSLVTADTDDEPSMFTDTRMLHGPLPAVAAGSVVEQTIVWNQKHPIDGAGITNHHQFGRWVATQRSRLILEHPASIALKVSNRTQPAIEPEKTTENGRTRIAYESGPLAAVESTEWNLSRAPVGSHLSVFFSLRQGVEDVGHESANRAPRAQRGCFFTRSIPWATCCRPSSELARIATLFVASASRYLLSASV